MQLYGKAYSTSFYFILFYCIFFFQVWNAGQPLLLIPRLGLLQHFMNPNASTFAHFVVFFHHNVRSVGLSSPRVGLNNAWYKSRGNLCIYYKVWTAQRWMLSITSTSYSKTGRGRCLFPFASNKAGKQSSLMTKITVYQLFIRQFIV